MFPSVVVMSSRHCSFLQRSAGDIMIRNIQLRHAGKYTCAVQTKVDSVSIATDVVVRGTSKLNKEIRYNLNQWCELVFQCGWDSTHILIPEEDR